MLLIIHQYLNFRVKQIFRILKDIGIGHLILLAPILFVAILGVLQLVLTSQNGGIALVLLFSWAGTHWNRKDRFFLEQLTIPIAIFFSLDYFITNSFFIFTFILWGKWQNLIILSFGLLILSFIKPPYHKGINKKGLPVFSFEWIPIELFEWRTGLRKSAFTFILIYMLGLGFSFYPITTPIFVLLMALGTTTFFQFFEHKDLLLAVNYDKKLLEKKTIGSLVIFNFLMLPHYLLFALFNPYPKHLIALLIVAIIAQLIITFSIVMKYKSYSFHQYKLHNSLPLAIFVGCWTIPFLWPIPVLMIIRFWKKAKENLIYHYA
ncbi:hypothetical protein [Aureispira sp. CCB-QB1]|uniref:hypothetical protein n=1 Tax=Aureispira sp. CCB-QB1 TaxID=1313421 RepID=UPI000696421A|nr:hypothetical protein [Aureispira sp. CCB-QB1]